MMNSRDLLFLSVASGAATIGNALGNGLAALMRGQSIEPSVLPTSACVAGAAYGFTLFSAVRVNARMAPIVRVGAGLLGAVSLPLLLNTATSTSLVFNSVLNSIFGFPVTYGVMFLFLNAFIRIEAWIISETNKSMMKKFKKDVLEFVETLYRDEHSHVLDSFIAELEADELGILINMKENLPEVFGSYRFIDYLLSKISSPVVRQKLQHIRETCHEPSLAQNPKAEPQANVPESPEPDSPRIGLT